MASHFNLLSDIKAFIGNQSNKNTVKKTQCNVKVLREFFASLGETRAPEQIPPKELDIYLSQFFMNATSANKREYQPLH